MSVTKLHGTSIARLARDTQKDGRLYLATDWAQVLAAYGLDPLDVDTSAVAYFRAFYGRARAFGFGRRDAVRVALGDLLAHGLLWGERLP